MPDRRDDYGRGDYGGDAVRWLAAGFGLGMLIGGALGILLAPKSGRETRDQLREVATDFGGRAKTVADDLSVRAREAAGEMSEKAAASYSRATERARAAAEEATERAKHVRETASRASRAAKEGYKKTMEELAAEEEEAEKEIVEE